MTKASDLRPTRRVLSDRSGQRYVIEIRRESITIRPYRSRVGGPAEVAVTPGGIYVRAFMARPARKRKRAKGRRTRRAGR